MKRNVMAKMARVTAALAASSTAVGVMGLASGNPTAHADPAYVNSLVGVGSDTIQDLFDAYAGNEPFAGSSSAVQLPLTATNTKLFGGAGALVTIASFDAIPFGGAATAPGCITTRLGGVAFDRPNGSGNGVKALRAAIGNGTDSTNLNGWEAGNLNGQPTTCTGAEENVAGAIDFSRSSGGPTTVTDGTASHTLDFIPFARDAVTYALIQAAGDPTNLGALTTGQLTAIYNSTTASQVEGVVSGTSAGDVVKGCLPQSGSGTRNFFLSAIASPANSDTEATAAGCDSAEENGANTFYANQSGGTSAATSSTTGVAYIIPFSVGSYISQLNGVAVNRSGNTSTGTPVFSLGDPNGTGGSVTTNTAPHLAPNATYYQDPTFGRDLFVVVPNSKVTGLSKDTGLTNMFAGSGSAICSSTAQTTAHTFGFDSLNSSDNTKKADGTIYQPLCGDLTDQAVN